MLFFIALLIILIILIPNPIVKTFSSQSGLHSTSFSLVNIYTLKAVVHLWKVINKFKYIMIFTLFFRLTTYFKVQMIISYLVD